MPRCAGRSGPARSAPLPWGRRPSACSQAQPSRSRAPVLRHLADQADPPGLAFQPGRGDRRAQPGDRREARPAPRPAGVRRRGAGREHDRRCRRRRQGRPRRLHLHDHDDVDAREQHRALQEAAVRYGQGLHADHPGLARQRAAHRARHRRLRRPEGLRRVGEAAEPADPLWLMGHRLVGQRLRRDPGRDHGVSLAHMPCKDDSRRSPT